MSNKLLFKIKFFEAELEILTEKSFDSLWKSYCIYPMF